MEAPTTNTNKYNLIKTGIFISLTIVVLTELWILYFQLGIVTMSFLNLSDKLIEWEEKKNCIIISKLVSAWNKLFLS